MINSIGSVVPAGACWRGGIRLRFAFIGSCFDDGGMNRQRLFAVSIKSRSRRKYPVMGVPFERNQGGPDDAPFFWSNYRGIRRDWLACWIQ